MSKNTDMEYWCHPMYDCKAYIQILDGTYAWVKGFECGTRKEDGLLCFIADGGREKYWLAKEFIDYEGLKDE